MAFSEKDIARRRTELQHAPNSDRFKYQKPDVSAPVNYGSSAPSSQKNNSNTSGSSQKVTGNYTEEAIARRRKELQHGGGDRFAYKGPDFSMLPAPRINPFNHLNYSDPVTQKFHQQTGWRDPGAQALYELAERTRNPQRKITPASVFRSGPLADAARGPRSRSAEAARQASEATRDALDQAAAGVRFNRTEAEKRRRSNAISFPETETADDEYSRKMEQRPEWLGGRSVGEYMRDFMNSQEALGTYGADVVREYNRIYDSQGAGAAQKYVMSKDSTGNPGMERIDAFLTGVGNASGINSIAGIAMGPENYRRVASEQQSISEAHPIASAAGAITGTLPLITTLGRFARAIPAVAGLSKAAQAVISGAAAMGGSTAIQEAGAVANGLISPGKYAGDVAVSGLAGIAGGALGNTVSQKGMQFLYDSGLINNSIARTVVAGLSGSGYSVGSTGVREASAFIRDPENYEADPVRIIKDASVAFAFGAISYIANGGTRFTMNEEASNERPKSKWFEDCSTPQEVDAKLRQYARQYHPDQSTGDADLFSEISAEATAQKAWMNVNAGAQAYQKAQKAYSDGNADAYQEAKAEYEAAVNALVVDVQSGAIQGQEAVEAIQVLQSVSANLAGPEAQAPATSGSEALAALADQSFPSTAPSTVAQPSTTGAEIFPQAQGVPGNPYERTAAQKLDTAARQLQALEYKRNQHPSVEQLNDELNSPFAVFENKNPEIAQIQTRTGEQKLAALAAQATANQAEQKNAQIRAIYEAGRTQNPDFQSIMDGATMLTEAEKTNAFYRGLTAAAAEAAGIGKEISYGGQQQEEGNYLSGEGSGRPVSLGVGEPVGGVRTQAGRVAEGWKDWSHSADSGIKRANVQISGGVPAEKIIRTAKPGQVIYQVESGHTPSMRKAAAMVRAYDPKVEVVPFVSGNDIRVISGEAARAFVDPERRSIGYRANDERAAGDQLARHELIELGVIDGKVDLNDALKHLSSGIREFVDDDIISDIADVYLKSAVNDVGSLSPEALSKAIQHANKEMLCDIGAGINQFDGVDGFELYAQVVDVAHDILHDYMNEKLGGAFDAEPESIPETKSVGASQADVGTALTVLKNTGISVNDNGTVAHMEYSTRYSWKTREEQEKAAAALQKTLGVSKKKALGFIQSEMSLTNMILRPGNVALMDYTPDDRYTALKKNSDYPQGTFDFNNNCRKRVPFTTLFDRIQMRNPNRLFTADDLEIIRQNMIKHNYPVACALCYVEERRQKLGEIADSFVKLYENDAVLDRFVGKTPFEKMKAALESVGDDPYKPTIADLVTYEGLKKLEKNHKGIADAFRIFNNARGMQSGRLVEGRAEYKRELLTYTPAQVKRVNDLGGIRVFSYSDFEAVNLLDLVQIIQDAASKGIMIQAYTKVPAFAKVVRNTGIKLNRSLIAAGTGVKYENGKKVLDLDPVEGININDPDFFDSTDDRDVGNILVGMSDEQIRLAMASPFVDYIIPFHTSLPGTILKAKKIDHWKNYKLSQTDKDMKTGKNAKNINIYTEVLQAAAKEGNPIKNKKDFVNKFLQVAKDKNLIPRFSEFLNTDKDGNFVYTEGYHKFLIDFKLFDKNGNIVEQKPVRPVFDDAYNTKLMEDFANGVGSVSITDGLYRDTVDALNAKSEGNKIQYSSKLNLSGKQGASGQRDSSGKTLTAQQADYFKNSKIRDADGNLQVMYHGTNADFNVFDTSVSGGVNGTAEGFGIYLADRSDVSDAYGDRLIKAYVNVTKPASSNKKTITRSALKKLIKATAMSEAEKFVADGDYENVNDAVKDSWISNYTNTYEKSLSASLDDVANQLLRMDDNDMGIIQEVMAGMGIRDYADAYDFYDILKRVTGFDGFETWWTNAKNQGDPARIVLAFDSNQVKNIDNENPTENADIRYSSKLQLQQKRDEDYSAAIRENDTETAGRLVKEAAEDAGYTEDIYHGTGAFGFTKFDLGKMDDGASIFATTDRRVAESYSGETNRELISKRAGESADAIIDRIDGTKDEDLLPLIKENIDPKYKRVPQERLAEMRDERVNDIRFYADKIMDFMDDNPGMFDETKSIAASRLASSMYKLSRARSADEVDEYLRQYNDDAWELKFMDESAFYEMFDGSSGIAATNNAISELNTLLESDVMFTNGEKNPGSTLDVLTPGEARTRLIGEMSKGIYHLYGKNENMLEFDANGDNWNMIDTARISNKAFRIKSTSNKDKAWLSGLYMPYNDAQSLAARAARDANGEDDYLDVKDLRDPLGRISGWEFRSHKTGEMVMELESALPSRAMTRDIAKYAREVGYDGVIMRNLKDSGGATAYNQPSDVYIYFKPNAVKSADTVTYDDGGNAIPLSARFDPDVDDVRYSTKLNLQGKEIELTEREEKLMEQLSDSYLKRIEQVTAQKDAQIAELKEQMKAAVGAEKEKARQRIEKLRQEKNNRIAYLEKQWRKNTDWRIAELKRKAEAKRGEEHDDMIRRLAKLQAQKDKKIEEILSEHRRQRQEARDRRNDRKLRVKFQKMARKALRDAQMKPGLASERVKELLNDIDLTALGMRDATRTSLHNKLLEIMEMRKTDENYLALHAEEDWKKVERLFKKQIKDMSLEEVSDMITELSALIHYQETTDKLIRDEQNRSAAEVGRQIVSDLKELTPLDVTNPVKVLSAKFIRDNLSPERAFNRLSGYKRDSALKTLYRQVLDGYTKVKSFEKKSAELFEGFEKDEKNKDFLQNAAKQTIPVTGKYGQTALISPAMRVSLYMASKNRDNQRHIATDGMTVPEPKAYAKGLIDDAYGRGTTIILEPTEIDKICAGMTESEKEFARLLETFFDVYAKEAINETSVDLDGVLKAIVDHYFPISSDKNFLAKSMDSFQDPTLEGWNNLKKRQEGANNKILLEDARQVLNRHIRNTARYYGLAIPLRNWNKVYGYTSHRDEFTGTRDSVQSAIKNAWNSDTAEYIERLIRDDINAGGRKAERGVMDRVRSSYAGSTLTLNAGVALKQTTSYFMAGSILDMESLMYGLSHKFTKADQEYMDSITPWGWARRQGESTIELGEMARRKDPITKNTPNWNQAMDVITTNALFTATERSIRKEYPGLKRGDTKYDEALAERYNQVLWRTQPQYESAFRPEYLRKTDIGSRTFGMFKTESMQMSGELIDAWGQWRADEKRARSGSEQAKRQRGESAKHFYKTFASWIASNMSFAMMGTALNILLFHKGKPYRNDRGEVDWQTIATKTGMNFISSLLGGFMFASTAFDFGSYLFNIISGNKATWYDIEVPGISMINDMVTNTGDWVGTLLDEDATPAMKARASSKFALAASKFSPLGFAENLLKLADSVNLYVQDIREGIKTGDWHMYEAGDGFLQDTLPTKDQYAHQAVYYAGQGNVERAGRALKRTKKANLEKALGRKVGDTMFARFVENPQDLVSYMKTVASNGSSRAPKLSDVPEHGFSSFTKLKEGLGSPNRNENWHHIVEQEQGPGDKNFGTFTATQINNANNVVSIPSGAGSVHKAITDYYGSVQDFTDGMTVREWLAKNKSFEEQFDFGIEQLRKFGDVAPTERGWVFIPNEEKIDEIPLKEGKTKELTASQKRWDTKIAEAREDGGLTDREIRAAALQMLNEGVPKDEVIELYKSKKNDKYIDEWMKYDGESGGDLSVYFGFMNAKSLGNQDGAAEYLNESGLSDDDKWALWELAGWSETSFDKKVN